MAVKNRVEWQVVVLKNGERVKLPATQADADRLRARLSLRREKASTKK